MPFDPIGRAASLRAVPLAGSRRSRVVVWPVIVHSAYGTPASDSGAQNAAFGDCHSSFPDVSYAMTPWMSFVEVSSPPLKTTEPSLSRTHLRFPVAASRAAVRNSPWVCSATYTTPSRTPYGIVFCTESPYRQMTRPVAASTLATVKPSPPQYRTVRSGTHPGGPESIAVSGTEPRRSVVCHGCQPAGSEGVRAAAVSSPPKALTAARLNAVTANAVPTAVSGRVSRRPRRSLRRPRPVTGSVEAPAIALLPVATALSGSSGWPCSPEPVVWSELPESAVCGNARSQSCSSTSPGRAAGSLSRQRSTIPRSGRGTSSSVGGSYIT